MKAETRRLWAWPLGIALFTASGLVSALVSDGWGDAWAWLGFAVPVVVATWFACRTS